MIILNNCDPKELLKAVENLEARYNKYYEIFKKRIISENKIAPKRWYRKEYTRTDEDAFKYGIKHNYDNYKLNNHALQAFDVFKLFKIDMLVAIKAGATVTLNAQEDKICIYLRDYDFNGIDP